MLTEEDKKYILNEFNLKRVWIREEGPEIDDFDETSCHFFDDGDPILKKYKEYNIGEKQYQLLLQLRAAFSAFVDGARPYLPEEFIEMPEWKRIMDLAKDVVKAFNYQKNEI